MRSLRPSLSCPAHLLLSSRPAPCGVRAVRPALHRLPGASLHDSVPASCDVVRRRGLPCCSKLTCTCGHACRRMSASLNPSSLPPGPVSFAATVAAGLESTPVPPALTGATALPRTHLRPPAHADCACARTDHACALSVARQGPSGAVLLTPVRLRPIPLPSRARVASTADDVGQFPPSPRTRGVYARSD